MTKAARRKTTRSVVAVTGTQEFLGAGLLARFERDPSCATVLALDAPAGSETSPRVRAFGIDLARPGSDAQLAEVLRESGAGALVHAAFCPAPTHQVETMHELESIGTLNVLSACERTVERLIVWSQTFLYGARPDNPAMLPESWPLRASAKSSFLRDKLAAEQQVADFAARFPEVRVAVLRTAPVVGPRAVGIIPSLVRRRFVPVAAGFDPLLQVLHEYDAYDAFKLAVDADAAGVFNVVADGVLPVTTALLVAGRVPIPVPPAVLRRLLTVLWTLRASETSGPFVGYLLFPCVADGRRAVRELSFRPTYSTHEALGGYAARIGAAAPPTDDPAAGEA